MRIDKRALRAAAEKATPGKWKAFIHTASGTRSVHTPRDKRCDNVIKWSGFDGQKNAEANAKFIAAANPATVISLLDELEAAEKRIAQLIHIINMHTVELGFGEKPITMAELIIAREGSGSDVLAAIRAAGITVKGE